MDSLQTILINSDKTNNTQTKIKTWCLLVAVSKDTLHASSHNNFPRPLPISFPFLVRLRGRLSTKFQNWNVWSWWLLQLGFVV